MHGSDGVLNAQFEDSILHYRSVSCTIEELAKMTFTQVNLLIHGIDRNFELIAI